jgi:glyceraldehyde 3-phosphate dehydrogenase
MARRIAINGFGRTGRLFFRSYWVKQPDDVEVVAINDPASEHTGALLLEYDSNYGRFPARIRDHEDHVQVDDTRVPIIRERDWSKIDWRDHGVHTVVDCSGKATRRDKADVHLRGGAELVVVSAPVKGDDATIVMGVNERDYRPSEHRVVSNASCTTNCLAPVALVLKEAFGLEWGFLTTVHSYTNSQNIHDRASKDPRESRAAATNIIPTETGAARALGRVLPELTGKFDGIAFRVPTPTVSAIDFVCQVGRPVTKADVNNAFRSAAGGKLRGILGLSEQPLVSSDYRGDERSAIVDGLSTMVLNERIVKVVAWYDNEWAYSCRLVDLAVYTAQADRASRREPSLAIPA